MVMRLPPAYSSTVAPLCGPLHPRRKDDTVAVLNRGDNIFLCNATKTLTGNIEETYVNDAAFYEQYHTFMKHGYAYDPSQARLIGDVKKAQENKGIITCLFITINTIPRRHDLQ